MLGAGTFWLSRACSGEGFDAIARDLPCGVVARQARAGRRHNKEWRSERGARNRQHKSFRASNPPRVFRNRRVFILPFTHNHIQYTKAGTNHRERLNRGGWAQMESALGTAAAPPPAPSPREIEEAFNNFGFDGVSSNRTLSIGEVAVGLRQLRLPVDHTLVQALLTKLEDEGVTSVGYQQFEGLVEQASAIGGRIERRRIAMQAELKLPLLDELITATESSWTRHSLSTRETAPAQSAP